MIRALSLPCLVAIGVLASIVRPAYAGDAAKEIATAAAHAGMAAGSADMKMVKAHLQHVVNCLVGPGGAGFDGNQANPCKDLGAGAIGDAAKDKKAGLDRALMMAKEGAMEMDLAKAKEKAAATQAVLNELAM